MITPEAMEKHTAVRETMVAPAEHANKRGRTGIREQVKPLVELGRCREENGMGKRGSGIYLRVITGDGLIEDPGEAGYS
jgi:hypothetical protein